MVSLEYHLQELDYKYGDVKSEPLLSDVLCSRSISSIPPVLLEKLLKIFIAEDVYVLKIQGLVFD